MTNPVLLIMNCAKYRWKAQRQIDGWLKNVTIPYYHVLGDENLDTPYKFDDENRILYICVPDDYCSLPKKVIRAFEACHKELDCDYIFKTDDDQILTDPAFFDRLIPTLDPALIHYGGHICKIEEEGFSGYWEYHPELPRTIYLKKNMYGNGRFYIVSRTAIAALMHIKAEIEDHYFEDYIVWFCLSAVIKNNILNILNIDNTVFVDMT